jgi:hypothetical protein
MRGILGNGLTASDLRKLIVKSTQRVAPYAAEIGRIFGYGRHFRSGAFCLRLQSQLPAKASRGEGCSDVPFERLAGKPGWTGSMRSRPLVEQRSPTLHSEPFIFWGVSFSQPS